MNRRTTTFAATVAVLAALIGTGRADTAAPSSDQNTSVTTNTVPTAAGDVTTTTTVTTRTEVRPVVHPVVIPFELMPSGHIALMAKVNDKGPYRFGFDTGAPDLVVSERVAKSAGVLPANFRRPFFTLLGSLGYHPTQSIDVSGGRQEGINVEVWNHPTVELLARVEGPLEGLIGFPFFAHFDMTIDYKAKSITLLPSPFQPQATQERVQAYLNGEASPATIAPAVELGLRVTKGPKDAAPGVTVAEVFAGGPAAAAGVKAGDRLLTLDERWTDGVDDCYAAAAAVEPAAKSVPATLTRDGKPVAVTIAVKRGV